jgi:hypothetical protein
VLARPRILSAVVAAAFGFGIPALPAMAAHAAAPVVSRGVTIPAFYTPPAALPAADGALVRTEPLPLALSLPGLDGRTLPGRATRLMYKTTDSNGRPAAVTGAYVEPSAAWAGGGPRPLVVVAPGTMGQGDQCAPSFGLEKVLVAGDGTISVGYENLAMYGLLSKGIAVAVTDYAGLGTTDRLHTYVNRLDEGHAVLDAARAARALPGTSLTPASPVGLYGYSQGGGAVAAAAELQPAYAPDVPLRATYSGAPPADLTAVTAAIDGTELAGALGWSVNGFLQSEPALRPLADKYLSAKGKAVLADLATMCVGDAIFAYAGARSSTWTTNGATVSDIMRAEPTFQAFVDRQRIGNLRPAGVVRVATGTSDNLVPHAQARTMALDWCRRGGNVVYEPVVWPDLGSPLLNHFLPLLSDQQPAIDWLTDRLAGRPAASNCALIPFRP